MLTNVLVRYACYLRIERRVEAEEDGERLAVPGWRRRRGEFEYGGPRKRYADPVRDDGLFLRVAWVLPFGACFVKARDLGDRESARTWPRLVMMASRTLRPTYRIASGMAEMHTPIPESNTSKRRCEPVGQ